MAGVLTSLYLFCGSLALAAVWRTRLRAATEYYKSAVASVQVRDNSLNWDVGSERLLLNVKTRDSWPPEETNSIRGQRRGWIAQSFCVIKFY